MHARHITGNHGVSVKEGRAAMDSFSAECMTLRTSRKERDSDRTTSGAGLALTSGVARRKGVRVLRWTATRGADSHCKDADVNATPTDGGLWLAGRGLPSVNQACAVASRVRRCANSELRNSPSARALPLHGRFSIGNIPSCFPFAYAGGVGSRWSFGRCARNANPSCA